MADLSSPPAAPGRAREAERLRRVSLVVAVVMLVLAPLNLWLGLRFLERSVLLAAVDFAIAAAMLGVAVVYLRRARRIARLGEAALPPRRPAAVPAAARAAVEAGLAAADDAALRYIPKPRA